MSVNGLIARKLFSSEARLRSDSAAVLCRSNAREKDEISKRLVTKLLPATGDVRPCCSVLILLFRLLRLCTIFSPRS